MTRLLFLAAAFFSVVACHVYAQAGYVPRPYVVEHYDLSIRVTPSDSSIQATAEIYLRSVDDTLENVTLDLRDVVVDSVHVDSLPAAFSQESSSLHVHLYLVMPQFVRFKVIVYYHGRPGIPAGETWGGFKWSDSKADLTYGIPAYGHPTYSIGVAFTDPEVSMTRRWLPCNDLPDSKATIDYHISVPAEWVAAANGKLVKIDSLGLYWTYHWSETHTIATYLMNINVGKFSVLRWIADSIPVEIYAMSFDTTASRTFFTFLDSALRTYQKRYGPYPFDKVGYVLAALGGGMEHQSLITMQPSIVHNNSQRSVAAHELAHQWWGDLVSPFEFKEAWLSEGLAQFSEAIFTEGVANRTGYTANIRGMMNSYLNSTAKSEGTFALYDFPRTSPSSNYPATIYTKGASVLGMLRWMLGDSLFFAGLQTYRHDHQQASATSQDLRRAFYTVTNDPLNWFFDEWVYKAGWPVVKTAVHQSDSIRIMLKQIQDTTIAPLFRMPYEIALTFAGGDTLRTQIMMEAVDSQVISLAGYPRAITRYRFDPDFRVLGKHTPDTSLIVDSLYVGVGEPTAPNGLVWISQNFPNPVASGSHTTIRLSPTTTTSGSARLRLYDVLGRTVRDYSALLEQDQEYVVLDLEGLPAGVYQYAFENAEGRVGKLMRVVR